MSTRLGRFVTVAADPETGQFIVDDAFVEEVERHLRVPYTDWDMIEPQMLLSCCVAVFLTRYEVKPQ